jgi:coenzyme F420-dependent glucose-6-phosphate dehydrogenase
MIEVKVSYDEDRDRAERDCGWWAALALSGDEKAGVEDPIEMERLADANRDRASSRFIVSDDPQEMADRIGVYVDLGFTELTFHFPGEDQRRALNLFARDVLPLLRVEPTHG